MLENRTELQLKSYCDTLKPPTRMSVDVVSLALLRCSKYLGTPAAAWHRPWPQIALSSCVYWAFGLGIQTWQSKILADNFVRNWIEHIITYFKAMLNDVKSRFHLLPKDLIGTACRRSLGQRAHLRRIIMRIRRSNRLQWHLSLRVSTILQSQYSHSIATV